MSDEHPALSRRHFLAATPAAMVAARGSQTGTSRAETRTSGVVADRGDVQQTIDRAANGEAFANGSYTYITLRTGTTYTPRRTWKVKRGVVLDFNGAKVVPEGGGDVVHLHPEAHLVRPFVDVRDRDHSASAIALDTRYGNYGGPNRATVENAHLLSDPGNGTGIELHDRADEGIWDTQFSGMVQGFETAALLRASGGPDAFVNSNHFEMTASAFTTAVRHRGVAGAAVNGNHFDLIAQPVRTSRHLWDLGGEAAFNTMEADVWDKRFYRDQSSIVRFAGGGDNTLVDRFGYTTAAHAQGSGRIVPPYDAGTDGQRQSGGIGGNTDDSGNEGDDANGENRASGGNDADGGSADGGNAGNANQDGGETRLTFEGTGSYTVVVEGSVRVESGVEEGKLFGGDAIEDGGAGSGTMSIEGDLLGGEDVYAVDGRVLRQEITGDVRVVVERSSA